MANEADVFANVLLDMRGQPVVSGQIIVPPSAKYRIDPHDKLCLSRDLTKINPVTIGGDENTGFVTAKESYFQVILSKPVASALVHLLCSEQDAEATLPSFGSCLLLKDEARWNTLSFDLACVTLSLSWGSTAALVKIASKLPEAYDTPSPNKAITLECELPLGALSLVFDRFFPAGPRPTEGRPANRRTVYDLDLRSPPLAWSRTIRLLDKKSRLVRVSVYSDAIEFSIFPSETTRIRHWMVPDAASINLTVDELAHLFAGGDEASVRLTGEGFGHCSSYTDPRSFYDSGYSKATLGAFDARLQLSAYGLSFDIQVEVRGGPPEDGRDFKSDFCIPWEALLIWAPAFAPYMARAAERIEP